MVSLDFRPSYKERYGMLRTEWRVVFHLGQRGEMTAKQICDQAALHKTKVSRAVQALEQKRYLTRREAETDRRQEWLALTKSGETVFKELSKQAAQYDARLEHVLGEEKTRVLKSALRQLIQEHAGSSNGTPKQG